MSRGKRSNKKSFVSLDRRLLRSPAYKALKPSAITVYIQILYGYNGNNGTKSKPIVCPYSTMGLAPATVKKALDELVRLGFIKFVQRGGLFNQPNSYELRQDWQHWQPPKIKANFRK